eukprot:SAG11_NODE_10837_length_802_cov_1.762447_1_plen_80_part_10
MCLSMLQEADEGTYSEELQAELAELRRSLQASIAYLGTAAKDRQRRQAALYSAEERLDNLRALEAQYHTSGKGGKESTGF